MLSDAPTRRPKARRTPIDPAGRDRIVRDFAGRAEPGVLIECLYTPPTEDAEAQTAAAGANAVRSA